MPRNRICPRMKLKGFRVHVRCGNRLWNEIIETGIYTKPWSSFDGIPILRIEIPRYKISQIVMKNTSAQNLAFGPAWHSESYLPKDNKVTINSGHRDSHFIYLLLYYF